jgi:SAM-dependent methyltransferase
VAVSGRPEGSEPDRIAALEQQVRELEQLVSILAGTLALTRRDIDRAAESRAWRWGHGVSRALRRATFRQNQTEGALARALARLEEVSEETVHAGMAAKTTGRSESCPICGSGDRYPARGRPGAMCAECGALERHRSLARLFGPQLENGRGKRCLEAGPANDRVFGGYLRERGWGYVSIDRWPTDDPHDPSRAGFVDHKGDLRDLSIFGTGEFDLFIAQHVIEEIEDYEQALDEIARVLRPGALALLEIPFDPEKPASEPHPPDHYRNVWNFGADLPDRVRQRFATVDLVELAEDSYRGTLLVCSVAPAAAPAAPKAPVPSADARAEGVPVRSENAQVGDPSWWGRKHAPPHALEGFTSWPSVVPGDNLELHVSTRPAARYRVTIHRLGWYGGPGGRTVAVHPPTGDAQGLPREIPEPSSEPAIPSCEWPVTDTIPVGADWVSGQYVARLALTEGEHADARAYIPFVVRESPERRADILVQTPFTTAQAYNNWGGKSLYVSNSTDGVPAVKISFDRPFPAMSEANLNARWPFVWDLHLIRFLEREGYDVAYTTDLDTHREPGSLLDHPLLITSGHDEYWSREMRDAFEAARAAGASLACMGANTCYWQVRFEDRDRTMVEYRRHDLDPEPDPALKTVRFRDLDPPRHECLLWGVQYQDGAALGSQPGHDYELTDESRGDPWLEGTGFERPATLEGLVGYEWDALQPGLEPPEPTVFFRYEDAETSNAEVVRHRTPAGGIVLATGSLQFSWGLDDWARPGHADPRLQRFMRNAIGEMIEAGSNH